MNPDGRRVRLWRDLGLGPLWTLRPARQAEDADPAAMREAASEAAGGAVGAMDWDGLEATVAACTLCALCKSRTQTVFGVGDRRARWMVIGEAPGAEEDLRGEP